MTTSRNRAERRRKQRVQLTRGLIARLGSMGVVIIDAHDSGARVEHFTRLDVGRKARLRFDWEGRDIEVEAVVVSCKVHRFAHGDDGTTVYQSGLFFSEYFGDAVTHLRDMVSAFVSRSLAEQVANARGIGPVIERNMPVFRAGQVAAHGFDPKQVDAQRLIPTTGVAVDRGYVRCTLLANKKWEKKWSRSADQPDDGFTVLASEPDDHVEQLCETYRTGTPEDRRLIQLCARLSVEKHQETPEPLADAR
jgi:hypothetical protein